VTACALLVIKNQFAEKVSECVNLMVRGWRQELRGERMTEKGSGRRVGNGGRWEGKRSEKYE